MVVEKHQCIRHIIEQAAAAEQIREVFEVVKIMMLLQMLRIVVKPLREHGVSRFGGCEVIGGVFGGIRAEHKLHGGRQRHRVKAFAAAPLGARVKRVDAFHHGIKKINAVRRDCAGAEDVEYLAAPGGLARRFHSAHALVARKHELLN